MQKDQCELKQIKDLDSNSETKEYVYECKKTGMIYFLNTYFENLDKNKASNVAFVK